ncbi:YraN family protein [Salegentibacter chungangensis]|uniref:UPF0102 protein ACFQ3Q_01175 n=1 Tax=Salegentibacter chungangensis TaxID=1335724 RepID=A0ABW3NPI8_9FLAO
MAEHNLLGKNGEELAADYLMQQGYEIVARNFRFQKAEVDIIALKDELLAVIEVKTRSTTSFGDPKEFVKGRQIRQLIKAIDHFVEEQQLNVEVRFDIVTVVKNKSGTEIRHFENAFFHF